MTTASLLDEPTRVDEPGGAAEFSRVLSQVAAERNHLIVCRNGEDLAALIPLEDLEVVRELLGRQEMEKKAAGIDWDRARKALKPPQDWFDGDEPKPF